MPIYLRGVVLANANLLNGEVRRQPLQSSHCGNPFLTAHACPAYVPVRRVAMPLYLRVPSGLRSAADCDQPYPCAAIVLRLSHKLEYSCEQRSRWLRMLSEIMALQHHPHPLPLSQRERGVGVTERNLWDNLSLPDRFCERTQPTPYSLMSEATCLPLVRPVSLMTDRCTNPFAYVPRTNLTSCHR